MKIDIMSVWRKLSDNYNDVMTFGPNFLLRHLAHLSARPSVAVNIPGYGKLYLRPNQSDVSTVRQVFQQREYDIGEGRAFGIRARQRYRQILADGNFPIKADLGANIEPHHSGLIAN